MSWDGIDDYYEEPCVEEGSLYLDEELEEIEKERGWPIEELTEADLMEIIYDFIGIDVNSAEWNSQFGCIEYTHKIA